MTEAAVLVRFHADVNEQQSKALLNVLHADLLSSHPESTHPRIRSLRWSRLQDTLGREPLLLSLILTVAVTFVVIVACTNIAGLQLLRTMARHHEIAARMAIGGGRFRIVQQLLTESLVLGSVGGIVGMLLAAGSMPVLNRMLPPELLVGRTLIIDWRVVAFGIVLTACVSMFFGLLIAGIGIYGWVAYSASQRSRETAVRIALGANRLALIRAFLVETSLIAMVGVAIGLVSMLALSGMLRATLGSLASVDPGTVVAITGLLLIVLGTAGFIPARRAAGVDPLASLRQD